MREFRHAIRVPYPRLHLVEQFFDFEHVPHVHPRSLGRIDVLTLGHHWVIADLRWPLFPGVLVRSRFRQEFHPRDHITAEVTGGFGAGARYEAQLLSDGDGTRVEELLELPGFLGAVAARFANHVVRRMCRVWEEDLEVMMCRGGWPGIAAVSIRPEEIQGSDGCGSSPPRDRVLEPSRSRPGVPTRGAQDPLVVPLAVVVLEILADRTVQMPLPKEDHALQALRLDREHEALRVGVAGRGLIGDLHG